MSCEGYLQRSSNILHLWHKLTYYKIVLRNERIEFVKVNSDGKTTVKHTFSRNNADILVVPVSKNPKSNNFFAFHILNAKNRKRITTYRANNIADMRKFMAALGGATSSSTDLLADDRTLGDIIDSPSMPNLYYNSYNPKEQLLARYKSFDTISLQPEEEIVAKRLILEKPPTYHEFLSKLPPEYYLPEGMTLPEAIIRYASGEVLDTEDFNSFDKDVRRPWNDTYLPPHGPPVFTPISIGYGLEIGYKSGYQALWDSASQKVFYIDHVAKTSMTEIRTPSPFPQEESPSGDALTATDSSGNPEDYKLKLTSMKIVGWDVDGVFKPNECIEVFNINIKNAGEEPLPSGITLSISSNPLVRFENISLSLPALEAGGTYEVPDRLYGRIFDHPTPNEPGPFSSEADFSPVIFLPNSAKKKLFTMQQKMQVEYPIKLMELKSPPTLLPGELGVFEITIKNVSNRIYGSDGKVTVELSLHLDARLLPATPVWDTDGVPYSIDFNHTQKDSFRVEVKEIKPKETLTIHLAIKMEKEAEVFDQCIWQASLYFRKKLIEYNFNTVCVAPLNNIFYPNADVIMVTKAMKDLEYTFWQHLFKNLNLSVCTWNPKEDNLFNMIKMSTVNQSVRKLLLYPCSDVDQLPNKELVRYLQGKNEDDALPNTHINIAVMVPPSCEPSTKHAIKQKILELTDLEELPTDEKKSKRKSKSLVITSVSDRSSSPASVTGEVEYSTSSVITYVMPLSSVSNFILIDGMDTTSNIATLPLSYIPLESHYGQAFLALLASLPLQRKLQLYENKDTLGNFVIPNSLSIDASDLVILSIAHDICKNAIELAAEPKVLQEILQDQKEEGFPSQAVKHQAVETSEVEKNPKNRKMLRHITHNCQHVNKHFRVKKKEIEKSKIPTLKQIMNLYSAPYQKQSLL
ncbi:uncharacterized protein [Dysidea avara]|uniref:uncharacterized protein n=1 Tax=Dysidea avara TaxID=196820 RepID=UPI003316AAB9